MRKGVGKTCRASGSIFECLHLWMSDIHFCLFLNVWHPFLSDIHFLKGLTSIFEMWHPKCMTSIFKMSDIHFWNVTSIFEMSDIHFRNVTSKMSDIHFWNVLNWTSNSISSECGHPIPKFILDVWHPLVLKLYVSWFNLDVTEYPKWIWMSDIQIRTKLDVSELNFLMMWPKPPAAN